MSAVWNGAGRRISICDVGLRDGLQMEARFVPTEDKIALVHALSAAGLRKIEVTSFTSPNAIPALRDAEVVMRNIERHPGVTYTALVPNARGAERAIESRVDELNLVMSVSGTHNLANLRMTSMQSFVLSCRRAWPRCLHARRCGACGGGANVSRIFRARRHGARCVRFVNTRL